MPNIKVNGITIYYEIHGNGEPLLLIGGLSNDITDYERSGIIELFAELFKVIAFDNRGAGRSDKPDEPYSIEMMAEDAFGLLDALNIKQANIVGVSMGGRIALQLVLADAEKVRKLVLVSTGSRTRASWRRSFLFAISQLFAFVDQNKQPRYAFKRQAEASSAYDCTNRLHEITAPTLILHGTKDSIAPLTIAEEMHRKIARSEMKTVRGGHTFLFFRPHEFTDAVLEFLRASIE